MRRVLPLVLLASFALTACDSGGDDPAAAAAELAASNAKISGAVTAGLTAGGARSAMPACPGGGTVDVVESGDGFRMTFANCNDVSGTFDVSTVTGGSSDFRLRYDGDLSVRNSCDVSYDAFEVGTSFDGTGSNVTLLFDGRIAATCPSGTTTCTFNDTPFTVSRSGTPAPDFTPYCN
jgi:hypothetical protein